MRTVEEESRLLADLLDSSDQPFAVGYPDGRLGTLNRAFERLTGFSREELMTTSWADTLTPPQWREIERNKLEELHRSGQPVRYEKEYLRRDGSRVPIELLVHLRRDDAGQPAFYYSFITDLTERKRAEAEIKRLNAELEQRVVERTSQLDATNQELQRANRALRVLSECNQTLIHAEQEPGFLREACRILVEIGGYRMAWVGYAERDERKTVRPVAHAGFEDGYLDQVEITWGDDARGRGPTGSAIRLGRPAVNRNTEIEPAVSPWREEQLKRAYASSIALPIRAGSDIWGALTIYATEPEAFEEEEVKLLTELAGDLSFGIQTLRTGAERQRAEEAVRENAARLTLALDAAQMGVWELDLVNDSSVRSLRHDEIFGYPSLLPEWGQKIFLTHVVPQDRAAVEKRLAEAYASGHLDFECRITRANDGSVRWIAAQGRLYRNGYGDPLRMFGVVADITERKGAEEKVRRASAEIRDLYNNAPCGYHSLDKDGLFLRINDTELRWLGYERAEVVGKLHWADVVTKESQRIFAHTFPHFVESGEAHDREYELVRKDGSTLPVLVSATAVRDEAGNYVMSRSTVYDVTEVERARKALKAERQRLFDVLETLPAMICLLTPEHYVSFANRSFREKFGESNARPCYDYCFGRTEPCKFCETFTVLETGRPHHWEIAAPDDSVIEAYDFPFTDVNGSPMILEMAMDITVRKRAEEKVRLLLESTAEAIYGTDLNGNCTFANRAFLRILGFDNLESLVGRNLHDQIHHSRADGTPIPASECRIFQAARTGQPLHVDDEVLWRADGTYVPVEYWSHPLRRDGKVIGTVVTFLDITERKRSEEEIRKLNASLEHRVADLVAANQELEAFSYSVSHDLRAPLRAMDGFSHALEEEYADLLDAKGIGYLRHVRKASQRMDQLVEGILTLSRLSRSEMRRTTVNMSALARTIALELKQANPERPVELVMAPGLVVNADGNLLRSALENLLGNAWKFTSKHSHARIELGTMQQDGATVYFLRDDGAGFDPAYANKLFGPFQRLHTEAQFAGTGIGLAIVHRIIQRHGGRIWVEGEVEKGATFFFTLG